MKAIYNKRPIPVLLATVSVCALIVAGLITYVFVARADVTTFTTSSKDEFRTYDFFASSTNQRVVNGVPFYATTTTATSTNIAAWTNSLGQIDKGYFVIAGAEDVLFYFTRGDQTGVGNSGSTRFSVQVSPDGTNWFDYAELGQITTSNTADGYFTRVGTTTLPAGTSTQMWIMDDLNYYAVRCIVVKVTDGEGSCKASANW